MVALGAGLRASTVMPLFARDLLTGPERPRHTTEVIGVLAVWWPEPHAPDSEELARLASWADLAAVAVSHARTELRLAHEATHDPLTGLANRTLLEDRMRHALLGARRTRRSVAVLFIDLDRFKVVNDSLGHDHGDELLTAVARRLEAVVRPADTVARFGGDEFVVFVPDVTGADVAQQLGERLLEAIVEPYALRGRTSVIGASIGIAIGGHDADPVRLLADADSALYDAKGRGRQRVMLFDPALRAVAERRLQVEDQLRDALAADRITCWFQPLVDAGTGRVVGAEALARWILPDGSQISPADFIPVAEDSGLVVPLGRHVLRYACGVARSWYDRLGPDAPTVAVNLSPTQLRHRGLILDVQAAITDAGLPPGQLVLELTETSLVDPEVPSLLRELRRLGVRLRSTTSAPGTARCRTSSSSRSTT
jgi:diguanylate cyclase (GGDEF)-like protein